MTHDRLALLRDLRPQTTLDAVWTTEQQAVVRERILLDRIAVPTARPRRRRVTALGVALAVGFFAVPGVAAAVGNGLNGMKPQSFVDVYSFFLDSPAKAVDPATGTRVATGPGPYGGQFAILSIVNDDGLTCLIAVFETPDSAASALPNDFEGLQSTCLDQPALQSFFVHGDESGTSTVQWWASAGEAVSGELRMPTGETYPVLYAGGYLWGWYPLPVRRGDQAPTLTGYAADGTVVGRLPV